MEKKAFVPLVRTIAHHPLIPETITVRGFIIDSTTGKLTPVEE